MNRQSWAAVLVAGSLAIPGASNAADKPGSGGFKESRHRGRVAHSDEKRQAYRDAQPEPGASDPGLFSPKVNVNTPETN